MDHQLPSPLHWVHYRATSETTLQIRKATLAIFVLSIIVSVIIGIVAVVQDEIDGRILLTALAIILASIGVLIVTQAMTQGKFGILPYVATFMCILTYIIFVGAVWTDWNGLDNVPLWKTAGTFGLFAVGLCYGCAIHTCQRAPLLTLILAEIFMAALLLIVFIGMITEAVSDAGAKALISFAILVGAMTIVVPTLHLCLRSTVQATEEFSAGEVVAQAHLVEAPASEDEESSIGSELVLTETRLPDGTKRVQKKIVHRDGTETIETRTRLSKG